MWEASLDIDGKLALERMKSEGRLQNTELEGINTLTQKAAEAQQAGFKVTADGLGGFVAVRGREMIHIKPDGVATPVRMVGAASGASFFDN